VLTFILSLKPGIIITSKIAIIIKISVFLLRKDKIIIAMKSAIKEPRDCVQQGLFEHKTREITNNNDLIIIDLL